MTPLIDVGFLLIVFFVLLCQYIVAENFPVAVPDRCSFARAGDAEGGLTTLTILPSANGKDVQYAVGSRIIPGGDANTLAEAIANALDQQLAARDAPQKVVCLRADRRVEFRHAQHALAAVAQSPAEKIQLAVFDNEVSGPGPQ